MGASGRVTACISHGTFDVVDERDVMHMIEIEVVGLLAMLVTISLLVLYVLIFYMFIKCLISKDWIPAVVLGVMLLWFSSLWLRILG